MTRVLLLHHHLHTGGVTRVLQSQILAFSRSQKPSVDFSLLTGARPEMLPEGVRPEDVTVDRNFNYLAPGAGAAGLRTKLDRMTSVLGRLAGKADLVHVHNAGLGKNPLLNIALYRLGREGVPILNHCHDFAEDGRFDNFLHLKHVVEDVFGLPLQEVLYPDFPNYFYGVLNSRDKAVVRQAGIPSSRIFHLMNPAIPPVRVSSTARERRETRAQLGIPGRLPFILYPVRGIRRKNLGEFLLLSALLPDAGIWAVSISPRNPAERPNWQFWSRTASRLGLPVIMGTDPAVDFARVMQCADRIATTSVNEGFGMLFLETWLHGKSLFGRDLPIITRDFKSCGLSFGNMYKSLKIPGKRVPGFRDLPDEYAAYMKNACLRMGRTPQRGLKRRIVEAKFQTSSADFGDLDPARQAAVLEAAAADRSMRKQICGLNRLEHLWALPESRVISANAAVVRKTMGLAGCRQALTQVYGRLLNAPVQKRPQAVTTAKCKRPFPGSFLDPERFRLIQRESR